MPAFQLATSRQTRSPLRCQQWNASIRGGDDVSLALSVYDDDEGSVTDLTGSASRLTLFRDDTSYAGYGWGYGYDYGWDWFTSHRQAEASITGVASLVTPGLINFAIPAATTAGFEGRYRLALQVGTSDGLYTQIEGTLQVRCGLGAGLISGAPPPDAPGAAGTPLPLVFVIPGKPPAGQTYNLVPVIATTLNANFAGTSIYAGTHATADAVFSVNRISSGGATTTLIGTVTITAGTAEGCVLSTQAAAVFAPGDVLQLKAPVSQDTTLADLGITLLAVRS